MNILQLVPKLNVGGVEKGTIEVARYLTLNGHKAVVVSGGGKMEKNLAAIGARHYTLPIGRKDPFSIVYCFLKLRQIIRKENINIVHARSRIPALTGFFAARSTGRIFITTAHGQYKKHFLSRVMGWGKVVIAANETMARHMKDNFGVPLNKIVVVPRGVDVQKFSYIPPAERAGKVFRLGMVCRFTPLKGHLDFIKAVSYVSRKIPNLEVTLMGDIQSARKEYLEKINLATRRLMVDKIVKIKNSDEEVSEALKKLDIFISANREQEAFGRSIIEAQSRGVPVVATRVGGVAESIIDGRTGLLCNPGDPADMADKIMRYMNDSVFMKEVSENARKHVEEHYSLDNVMALKIKAYKQVLEMKNILIFKISSLGDIILATPSIRAIRERFRTANIKILVDARFREIFDACPYVNEVITCDFKHRDKGLGLLRLAERLRSEDFDITVDLQNNKNSHLLAFLSMAPERYGYNNGKWSFFINRKIGLPKQVLGPVEHQKCVLGLLGITSALGALEMWPTKASEEWAENFLKEKWLVKEQKLVAFSLSASKKWSSKNWPLTHAAELANIMAKEQGARVILIGSSEDAPLVAEFLKKTKSKPIDAVGKTGINELASIIKRCDALVGGDSAPIHIAAAVGTPFVALFGPTDPARHFPPSISSKILYKKIDCAPCYNPDCPKDLKCMKNIKPAEVYNALVGIMK